MPLRLVLIAALVLQISLAVGLTGWLSWQHGQQAIAELATQLQMEMTQRVQQRLASYLKVPQWANQEALNALELGLIAPQDSASLRRYFWQQVKAFEQINTIQFGSKQGDYIGAGRGPNGDLLIKVADRSTNREFRSYQAADGGLSAQLLNTRPNYKLAERPWYQKAKQAGRSVWSDIYVMFSHRQLGMTLSQPVYNRGNDFLGVLGTDILLSDISTFLRSLEVGKTGEAFILERSGHLIASSSLQELANLESGEPQRLLALKSSDRLVRRTVESLTEQFGDLSRIDRSQQFKSQANGQAQFVQVTPFQDDRALDWLIVLVIPEADFQDSLNAYARNTLALCLLAIAIATLTGLLTSRWLAQPIVQLIDLTSHLARGNWEQSEPNLKRRRLPFRFRETALLARTFAQMRLQLQQSFNDLERAKAELKERVEQRTLDLQGANAQLRQEIVERQQTEGALRRSEVKFRNLFANSQVGIFRTRLKDGLFLDANQCCAKLLGYSSPTEIVERKDAGDFYVQLSDRERMMEQLERDGELHNFETKFRKQDGSTIWVLCSGSLNRDEGCLEGVITDVTNFYTALQEQQLAQEAVQAREEMYRDLVQTANCIILRWDRNGYIRFLNDYGRDFFGYGDSILGKSVVGTIVPETETSGRDLQVLMQEICQHPEQYRFNENENLCSNGDRVWVSWANKPIFDRQGRLIEILSVGTDATARKQAEAALREQEQYLRLIVDNIPQQVFWKDTNLVFKGCNRNWAEAAGLNSPEEVVGKTDYDMLPDPDVAERFRRQDRYIVETDTPQLHVTAKKQKPGANGKTVWLDINKLPIHDSNGKVIGILGVLEDITQRKLAEDALRLEQKKSEALLLNILPAAIAKRLKEHHGAIAEHFEEVTILFADIVGFTPLSAELEPIELVDLLNHIFSAFDRLADKYGLEKIKTIGDAYMVVGGLPVPHPDRDGAIAAMALEMQQAIERFQSLELPSLSGKLSAKLAKRGRKPLQIRIGINTGSVVAGAIGIKKFIYDLWGDAVNVASRMESQGEPGRIQVSAATYERLKDRFLFEERGAIRVKGKGEMTTYWLISHQ